MKQVLVILIKKSREVEEIRKSYLKDYKKFKPHITLVYPFKIKDQRSLNEHIENSLQKLKPFELTLEGLKKSAKEYYLYLLVKEGKKELMHLYKNLNSGILKNFKNKDMPVYIPHITLGIFDSKDEINNAIKKIERLKLRSEMKVTKIELLTLNSDNSIKKIEEFKLK